MNNEADELYVKIGTENETGFDLVSLGTVFNGLDGLIKELHAVSNINGDLKLKVKKVEEGSVLLTIGADIVSNLPFEKISDLLNFLLFTAPDLYKQASSYFNEISGVQKSLNDYFNTHSFNLWLTTLFLERFVPKMISLAPKFKKSPIVQSGENEVIPDLYARKLHEMIVTKKFTKLAMPVAEKKIKYVSFSSRKNKFSAAINNSNFEEYLSEDEKILPEWENGQSVELTGEIVVLQSTQGETLKFKAIGLPQKYSLLVVILAEGKSSEEYINYYKKQSVIKAEVFRSSVYKKPKLIIKEIDLLQSNML